LTLGPRPHRLDRAAVVREEFPAQPQIVVHIGNDSLDVVLHRLDSVVRGREPELLVGIEPKVFGDIEDAFQLRSQPLSFPVGDGLVPPHGPFPTRQSVHRLEIHHAAKTFYMIHGPLTSESIVSQYGLDDILSQLIVASDCGEVAVRTIPDD